MNTLQFGVREEWTIKQLAAFCENNRQWRRITLEAVQQDDKSPLQYMDMALFFTRMAVSEQAVTLTGNKGEFTIDEPQSVNITNLLSYYWIRICNSKGAAFIVLAVNNAGVGTDENELNENPINIASAINSVSISYTDTGNGFSLNKVFSHMVIADNCILLHDVRYLYNNYMSFTGVQGIELENNVLCFTDGTGTVFELNIDANAQMGLESLTTHFTGSCVIPELETRKIRYSALQRLSEWIDEKYGKYSISIDTHNQRDNSPFKLHDWHLIGGYIGVQGYPCGIVFHFDNLRDRLTIEVALFSLDKTSDGFMLNITDTSGKTYAIEYRRV